jgi:small subunit ribosomal protein S18
MKQSARLKAAAKKKKKKKKVQSHKVSRLTADRVCFIDYKDVGTLKHYVTERGKIIPRRISGNCALHQRSVAKAVKQSRGLALIPYLVLAS